MKNCERTEKSIFGRPTQIDTSYNQLTEDAVLPDNLQVLNVAAPLKTTTAPPYSNHKH